MKTCDTLKTIASQFVKAETDGLENPQIFKIQEVVRAGGLDALKALGKPTEILHETKRVYPRSALLRRAFRGEL